MAEQINSPREIIKRLGGITEVARLLGRKPSAVGNWYERGFPPDTYPVLTKILKEKNLSAPPTLWGVQVDIAVNQ